MIIRILAQDRELLTVSPRPFVAYTFCVQSMLDPRVGVNEMNCNHQQTSLVPFQLLLSHFRPLRSLSLNPTPAAGRCYERRPPLSPLIIVKCRRRALKTFPNVVATPRTRERRWNGESDRSCCLFVIAATSTCAHSIVESLSTTPRYAIICFALLEMAEEKEQTRLRGVALTSALLSHSLVSYAC